MTTSPMAEPPDNPALRALELWDNMPKELESLLETGLGIVDGDRIAALKKISEKYPDFNPFVPRWLEL